MVFVPGIGFQVCLMLASRGCRVIIADVANSEESKRKIIEETNNSNIITKHIDLASFKSIREFAEDIVKTETNLDILIHNAGVSVSLPTTTSDGVNKTFQINYYGPFLLTHLLIGMSYFMHKLGQVWNVFCRTVKEVSPKPCDLHQLSSQLHKQPVGGQPEPKRGDQRLRPRFEAIRQHQNLHNNGSKRIRQTPKGHRRHRQLFTSRPGTNEDHNEWREAGQKHGCLSTILVLYDDVFYLHVGKDFVRRGADHGQFGRWPKAGQRNREVLFGLHDVVRTSPERQQLEIGRSCLA